MNDINFKKVTVIVLILLGFNMSSIHAQYNGNALDVFAKLYNGNGKGFFKTGFKIWPPGEATSMLNTYKYETNVFVEGARECFLSPFNFNDFIKSVHNNFMKPADKFSGYMYTATFGPFSSLSLAEDKVRYLQKPFLDKPTAHFSKDIFSSDKNNEIIYWYFYTDNDKEYSLYKMVFEIEGSKGVYKVNYKLASSGIDKTGEETPPWTRFTYINENKVFTQFSEDIQRAIKEGESGFKSITSNEELPKDTTKNIDVGSLKSTFIFANYPDCYISKGFRATNFKVLIAPYYNLSGQDLNILSTEIDKALGINYVKVLEISEDNKVFTVKYVKKDMPFKIVMRLFAERKNSTDNNYAVRLIF